MSASSFALVCLSREGGNPLLDVMPEEQKLDWTDVRLSEATRLRGNDGLGHCQSEKGRP
jgi:hypothetical protein